MSYDKKGLLQIQTDKQHREMKEHGSFAFPVRISHEVLSNYQRQSFFWHWHPQIELTLILEGDICYQVNEQLFELKSGDGLFCNSNMPHTGCRLTSKDCIYMSITFDPRIIYGFESSLLQTKYVTPLTLNPQLAALPLCSHSLWQKQILAILHQIWQLNQQPDQLFEFRIQLMLSQIWLLLYEHAASAVPILSTLRDRERILTILSYLHHHYTEKIRLEDVAAQINICPGECCRLFKKQMQQSVFDYLIHFRIEKSLALLADFSQSITDIAAQTGFSNPCYFSKLFRQQMQCSPSGYRKQLIAAANE